MLWTVQIKKVLSPEELSLKFDIQATMLSPGRQGLLCHACSVPLGYGVILTPSGPDDESSVLFLLLIVNHFATLFRFLHIGCAETSKKSFIFNGLRDRPKKEGILIFLLEETVNCKAVTKLRSGNVYRSVDCAVCYITSDRD